MATDWEARYKRLIKSLDELQTSWKSAQHNDCYYWTERNAGLEQAKEDCADELKYTIEEVEKYEHS